MLTICTVSYRSASLLDLNLSLTRELNPAANFHWLIMDNNNDFHGRAPADAQPVQLFQGDACVNQGKLRGSYHHAQALNKALQFVSTRYLMVIDPDFFIFRRNWVNEVLAHMSANDLSFWGAPYYPDLTWKRRYFPTVSCMVIDLEKTGRQHLDFTPELDEYLTLYGYPTPALLGILMGRIPAELRPMNGRTLKNIAGVVLRIRWAAEPLSRAFPKRFHPNVDVSRDTGFKIQDRFSREGKRRVETLLPAFENDLFTPKNSLFLDLAARLYYLLVPEKLSIYPKRRSYTASSRFKEHGLFDARGEFGWEEYLWQERPFAMHIKSGTRKFEEVGYDRLRQILFQLAGKPL